MRHWTTEFHCHLRIRKEINSVHPNSCSEPVKLLFTENEPFYGISFHPESRTMGGADFFIFYCLVSCPEIGTHVRIKLAFCLIENNQRWKALPCMKQSRTWTWELPYPRLVLSLVGIQHSHLLPNCNIWTEFCLCKNIQKVLLFIPVWNWNQVSKPQNCCPPVSSKGCFVSQELAK